MHVDALATRLVLTELADRLEERQALDVPDCAADLAEHEIDLVLADEEEVLDLVGDMRNDLDGLAEIVSAAFLLQHVGINPARGDGIRASRRYAGEPLVMAEIEVGLGAVIGHEYLAVLEWRHRTRIDVEIGVELAQADRIAAGLEQRAEGGRGEALAKRRHDAACYEYVPRHVVASPRSARVDVWEKRASTGFNPYGYLATATSRTVSIWCGLSPMGNKPSSLAGRPVTGPAEASSASRTGSAAEGRRPAPAAGRGPRRALRSRPRRSPSSPCCRGPPEPSASGS